MSETDAHFQGQLVALLPRLRRFARALTRDRHDADDLVQVAVERALARADQWRPGSSMVNWVLAIVRNAWLDELRSRRRRQGLFAPLEAADNIGEGTADREVERLSIVGALERLPEEQRTAVALVLVEGLSYREAAAVMDTPLGTLTSRLARGRSALESMLTEGLVAHPTHGDTR